MASEQESPDQSIVENDQFYNSVSELVPVNTKKMTEHRSYQIHRFNGHNYQLWRRQMEIYMAENKLKEYILGSKERTAANQQEWDEKDVEAQAFLMRGLELEQLKYMSDCTTSNQMWNRLKSVHAEKSEQSAQVLLEKFINSKMQAETKVADSLQKFRHWHSVSKIWTWSRSQLW